MPCISRQESIMSSDHSQENPHNEQSQEGSGLKRRDLLLSGSSLLAALSITGFTSSGASPATNSGTGATTGAAAEHRVHHGRRRRLVQHWRLSPRDDVRQDAKPRQARLAGRAVHGLLRRSQLHRGPGRLHHRRNPLAYGADDGRPSRGGCRNASPGLHDRDRAQGARLCYRTIRQEPSRRSEQIPADAARLR